MSANDMMNLRDCRKFLQLLSMMVWTWKLHGRAQESEMYCFIDRYGLFCLHINLCSKEHNARFKVGTHPRSRPKLSLWNS